MEVENNGDSTSVKRARTTPQNSADFAEDAIDTSSSAGKQSEASAHMLIDDVEVPAALPVRDAAPDWDVRKFQTIASSKYSKDRVAGSQSDTVFAFGEAPQPARGGETSGVNASLNGEESIEKPENNEKS